MSVTLLEPGLHALLVLPTGPVGRNVTVKAEAVAMRARSLVQAQFVSRSGDLERSIGVFPEPTPLGLECEVGTGANGVNLVRRGANYGRVLELGGAEHIITPATQRVLVSEPGHPNPLRAPRFRVFHPGPAPKPWLRPALEAVFAGG